MLAGRSHPCPDATSPAAVGQELRRREAGAPCGNAKHHPGCRAEKPPTPHPAPVPTGLRATRGDESNPNERLLRQLHAAHSFLPRKRLDASPPRLPQPASVAGSGQKLHSPSGKHSLVCTGCSVALGCTGHPPAGNPIISFLQPAWGWGEAWGHARPLLLPALTALQTTARRQKRKGLPGSGGALSQPLFFPLACRVPSSLAGC